MLFGHGLLKIVQDLSNVLSSTCPNNEPVRSQATATMNLKSYLHFVIFLIVENVELTSNKERQFTCPGDLVTFTCRAIRSFTLEWHGPLITQRTLYSLGNTPPRILNRGPFTASLISISGTFPNINFASTLQVTASRMFLRNETTVMCLSGNANKTDNFTVAGK